MRSQRIAQIRRFGARLKMVGWLTMPVNVFPPIPDLGIGLFPLSPQPVWTWRLSHGEVFISQPLVYLGFYQGAFPNLARFN